MKDSLAYVDGEIVPGSQAKVALLDRGHLLGDGVFETLRTHEGRPILLDAHERRMRDGLEAIGLREDVAEEAMGVVLQLAAAGSPKFGPDLYLRVQVTTGVTDEFLGNRATWNVSGLVRRLDATPSEHRDPGIRLVEAPQRKVAQDPLSRFKATSYLSHLSARRHAVREGADDAILLNDYGRVAEASTSNIFALVNGRLHAPGPEEGAVDGTVRAALLGRGFEGPVERTLTIAQLREATEAFVTNSIAGVLPVRSFHARDLAGARGSVTMAAMESYRAILDA